MNVKTCIEVGVFLIVLALLIWAITIVLATRVPTSVRPAHDEFEQMMRNQVAPEMVHRGRK